MTISTLLRGDLARRYWRSYLLVCAIALAAHGVLIVASGIQPSTDFRVRYDPAARQMLSALGWPAESGAQEEVSAYGWSRLGYISFVALGYALWGPSLASVIYPQIAIVWLVYPLIFHVLLSMTARHAISLGAIGVWMTFYDGYQWHFWAVPDSLYRFAFVAAFYVLLRLWETGQERAFAVVATVATLAGTLLRIETPLYALPAAWAALCGRRALVARWIGLSAVLAAVAAAWLARDFLGQIADTFISLQARGFVLPGSGMDVPGVTAVDPPAGNSPWEWTGFMYRLFWLRAWYALTPFPALWSTAHRLYYGVYALTAYGLTGFGLVHAWRQGNWQFFVCLYIFAAGIVLQMLVAVDPSMRYAYTPHVFLFICAVFGWQDLWDSAVKTWRRRAARAA